MKPKLKAILGKWLRKLAWLPLLVLLFVLILEVFYRNQWIDTYKRELVALNPDLPLVKSKKTILVLGDSFSAASNSWVNVLRKRHPELQFVNSSVPGTSILQANLILSGRLAQFKPDLLIYQVYVGNDLFDLRYPINWSEMGLMRNLYWATANHFRSLAWLNYALGQWKRSANLPDFEQGKVDDGEFDPQKYSERERLYLQAEPGLIADEVLLMGARAKDMEDYVLQMRDFIATAAAANVPLVVMVVPHCAQVHPRYAARMQQLGALGMEAPQFFEEDYPFMHKMRALAGGTELFLNLLPDLREREDAGGAMYYLHDAHLNDAGQDLVADLLDNHLSLYFDFSKSTRP